MLPVRAAQTITNRTEEHHPTKLGLTCIRAALDASGGERVVGPVDRLDVMGDDVDLLRGVEQPGPAAVYPDASRGRRRRTTGAGEGR